MKNLYIFRHGESIWNIENRCQGQKNDVPIPLTENGINQAKSLSKLLKNTNIEIIISSDLERAKETSQIISDNLNIPIDYDIRLRETNLGYLEGLTIQEIYEKYPDYKDRYTKHDYPFPGGECINEVKKRIKECLTDIVNTYSKQNIGICSHGNIIGNFLAELTNEQFIKINNAELVYVSYDEEQKKFFYG